MSGIALVADTRSNPNFGTVVRNLLAPGGQFIVSYFMEDLTSEVDHQEFLGDRDSFVRLDVPYDQNPLCESLTNFAVSQGITVQLVWSNSAVEYIK